MQYRRARLHGGTYFFTVNLADRQGSLLIDKIDILRNAISLVIKRHPFTIDAIVVLPEHLHTLWSLPENDVDYATRWMLIKSLFSRQIPKEEKRTVSRIKKGERGIWQRRYWEHLIQNEQDYNNHVEYIHYNPVKHGYVNCASDWEYSSIHRYINNGIVKRDWGTGIDLTDNANFGERK
jgi:putative transposase